MTFMSSPSISFLCSSDAISFGPRDAGVRGGVRPLCAEPRAREARARGKLGRAAVASGTYLPARVVGAHELLEDRVLPHHLRRPDLLGRGALQDELVDARRALHDARGRRTRGLDRVQVLEDGAVLCGARRRVVPELRPELLHVHVVAAPGRGVDARADRGPQAGGAGPRRAARPRDARAGRARGRGAPVVAYRRLLPVGLVAGVHVGVRVHHQLQVHGRGGRADLLRLEHLRRLLHSCRGRLRHPSPLSPSCRPPRRVRAPPGPITLHEHRKRPAAWKMWGLPAPSVLSTLHAGGHDPRRHRQRRHRIVEEVEGSRAVPSTTTSQHIKEDFVTQ